MTKIALISDLHEHLPNIKDVDMVIFCGDFCFRPCGDYLAEAAVWYSVLGPYFSDLRNRGIKLIGCPGNHDFICQPLNIFEQISSFFDVFEFEGVRKFEDLKIMFMAYCKLPQWAMFKTEEEIKEICDYYATCVKPGTIDFFISHTGPHDILSCNDWGIKPIGDLALKIKPKHFHAFGHIHSRFGMVQKNGITYVNCSYTNPDYSSRKKYVTYDTITKEFNLVPCEDL